VPRTIEVLGILCLLPGAGVLRAQGEESAFAPVARILQSRCAMPGCHAGAQPAKGMRLEADQIYRSVVNVRAVTDDRFFRVAPGDPDHSLLYLKLLSPHQGDYRGPRMPLSMDPLGDGEIAQVRAWIETFPEVLWGPPKETAAVPEVTRAFQDAYLANLPTPDSVGARTLEFRFAHRFKASATDAGSKGLYGLDSGAWVALELLYGIQDRVELGLRRTNLETDYEGYVKAALIRQRPSGSPLAVSFRGSVSNVRETDRFNRTRWGGQLILARRFGERLSMMLVPAYVTSTNQFDPADTRGTGTVGGGVELRLDPRRAITGEWIVQTSGVKAPFQSASLGFSMATARHVFHLMVTNTSGHLTDLVAPGGDLDPGEGEFRFGFNISRTHTFRPPGSTAP
jgi:uncharacterized beta barrel domain-containing protein DUF5777